MSGSFSRIQCTPDLLPSDIVGTQVYDASTAGFTTHLGPVHANIVLLDEINRASAKTQSAMLEAMQERQTSIGGQAYPLPAPFLVLATQNPIEQEGTYILPEAQLDRFMLKDVLDYPTPRGGGRGPPPDRRRRLPRGPEAASSASTTCIRLQELTRRVYLDPAIVRYVVGLVYVTRHSETYIAPDLARYVEFGASPRGSIAFTPGGARPGASSPDATTSSPRTSRRWPIGCCVTASSSASRPIADDVPRRDRRRRARRAPSVTP